MNDRCYYFHNQEVKIFDDAQKICSEKFKEHGFKNGRLYEPKDLQNFAKIYELAEQFSKKPRLQIGGVEFPLHWSLPYSPQEIPL